jgi:general secretion pathway protein K
MKKPRAMPGPVPARRQRGAAVIAALIIVAVVAALCSSLFLRQTSTIRQIENEEARVQARWFMQGGIDWGLLVLRDHYKRESTTRGDQIWATPVRDSRIPQQDDDRVALFSGRLEDEQGKFNLYNLAANGRIVQQQLEVLQRLLSNLSLPGSLAARMAGLIMLAQPRAGTMQGADFYGGNSQDAASASVSTAANGASSSTAAQTPDAAAGSAEAPLPRGIDDVAGLLGLDDATRQAFTRTMTVLPAVTFVNINTAPPEVIAALVPGLSLSQARSLAGERDRGRWFINSGDFANRLAGQAPSAKAPAVVVTSSWFAATGAIDYERARVTMRALLSGAGGTPRMVWIQETQ